MNKKIIDVMLISSLLSTDAYQNPLKNNYDDIKYLMNENINNCQIDLYLMVIGWINNGLSYEEIGKKIDNLDLDSYRKLTEEEKEYVSSDIKNILVLRKDREKREE